MESPKTLQQAIVYFSDPDRAFQYALTLRWPDGVVTCPRCNGEKHSFIKTRKIWYCNPCKKQFTLKVGTIFEDSPIGLDKWMTAFWMLTNCKNGIIPATRWLVPSVSPKSPLGSCFSASVRYMKPEKGRKIRWFPQKSG